MSTIIRWNPLREMAAMQNAMDRLFDETWRATQTNGLRNFIALDVHETDSNFVVVASVPGVNPEQIDVTFHNDVLSINVNIPQPETADNTRVLLQERAFGQFTRSLTLGQPVDIENAESTYENGVLTLTLPKSAEAQPRRIQVKRQGLLTNQN